jgi:hypothetical protein
MAIFDLFSTSFLFSTAIIILLIGGIFAYVSYRMSEQDHKLSSMVSLVSILAQDLTFVKRHIAQTEEKNETSHNIQYPSEIMGGECDSELISVSDESDDGDNDSDDGDNDSDDGDNDSDDGDNDSDDGDNDSDDGDNESEVSNKNIRLLNLTLANDNVENDSQIEDLNCDFEELNEEVNNQYNENIKTVHLETSINFETPINFEEIISEQVEVDISDNLKLTDLTNGSFDLTDVKNVSVSDLGETDDLNTSKSDYKKMSLNKLREVVVSKGLIADSSKLKKIDILKLLGEE